MMWLMAAPLSLTMWWRPSGVKGPLHWSCKPTMGIHHAYSSYNARGSDCTWTWSFDLAIVHDRLILLGLLLPDLNSVLVNRLIRVPLLGGYIPSMEGWGRQAISRLKTQVCVCVVCVCACACMRACVCDLYFLIYTFV